MISSKKILHICSLNLFRYGTSYYSTDWKIRNGLIRNGHHVYDFSYREVIRWENPFRTTRFGSKKMNKRLLQAVDRYRPDLVLFGHSEMVDPDTIGVLRKRYPLIKLAQWYVDSIAFDKKYKQLMDRSCLMDVVFATTGGELLESLKTDSNRVAFFPNTVDGAVESHKNHEKSELPVDFIFCGRDYSPTRTKRMKKLFDALSGLRCETWGCLGKPAITGSDYYEKLSQAASGLNLSHAGDIPFYSSDRMTQLLGCGLLTFTPETPGMRTLFSEDEVVYFSDDEELVEKVIYYSQHQKERQRIAANGWRRSHSSYNVQRVTKFMMETICEQPYSDQYEWLGEVY